MRLLMFLVLIIYIRAKADDASIDPSKTIVWGPGLKPAEVTMRARYFFLQLVDADGRKLERDRYIYKNNTYK